MKFKRNADGSGRGLDSGYLVGRRVDIAWRGFTIRPLFRLRPIRIGSTKLYTLGPIALFWKAPK